MIMLVKASMIIMISARLKNLRLCSTTIGLNDRFGRFRRRSCLRLADFVEEDLILVVFDIQADLRSGHGYLSKSEEWRQYRLR